MSDEIFLSVIIPVLEEKGINETINRLSVLDTGIIREYIISDGSPSGSTVALLSSSFRNAKGIISAPGRGVQMNRGAEAASGDILLFLHADTLLSTGSLAEMKKAMISENIFAGAFSLSINSNRPGYRLIEFFSNLRSRLFGMPFGDQGLFIRREDFFELGGFSEIPLMEDVNMAVKIKKRGRKIKIIRSKAITSPHRWERHGLIMTTLRNWIIQYKYLRGTAPDELHRIYYGGQR